MTNPGEQPGWDAETSVNDAFSDDPLAKALEWIGNIEKAETPRGRIHRLQRTMQSSNIQFMSREKPPEAIHIIMHAEAVGLCEMWDIDPLQNIKLRAAKMGYQASRSLAMNSGIMTVRYGNFFNEVQTLKDKGRLHAAEFGETVFKAMATLDSEASIALNQLNESLSDGFSVMEEEALYQRAGIALAYALAARTSEPDITKTLLS